MSLPLDVGQIIIQLWNIMDSGIFFIIIMTFLLKLISAVLFVLIP